MPVKQMRKKLEMPCDNKLPSRIKSSSSYNNIRQWFHEIFFVIISN